MNLDVDFLIKFYKNNTKSSSKEEFSEQETAGGSAGASTGGGGKAMPQWADVVGGPARSKANMLGKKGELYNTGVKRGVSNQIW